MLKPRHLTTDRTHGFVLVEALIALLLLSIVSAATLAVVIRLRQSTDTVRAHIQPDCSSLTCSDGADYATCTCGEEQWIVLK